MQVIDFSSFCSYIFPFLPADLQQPVQDLLNHPAIKHSLPQCPASGRVRYHHAYVGGLIDHIYDVIDIAMKSTAGWDASLRRHVSTRSIILTALIHDLHKVGDPRGNAYYVPNMLKSGKQSVAEPYEHGTTYSRTAYNVDFLQHTVDVTYERILLGALETHGKLVGGDFSLALVAHTSPALYQMLTDDEKFAIRYHDGAYAHSPYDSNFQGKETPLQLILHNSDMLSSRKERFNANTHNNGA